MKQNRIIKSKIYTVVIAIVVVVAINIISSIGYFRKDLTQDKRYTLSESFKELLQTAQNPLIIDVFLTGGTPKEFRLLRDETEQLIDEIKTVNKRVIVNYIDPLEDETNRDRNIEELTKSGLEPYVNSTMVSGKASQELVFPWAFASYDEKTVAIPLMKRSITEDIETQMLNSVQGLEYAFADGFRKILQPKSKKIAILKGNEQLEDLYVADFLKTLQPYYNLAPFTLDSIAADPNRTLGNLKRFDLIISAKPSEPFTETEKLVLDQYTMSGGKSIWLTEGMIMDKDSLYSESGSSVSVQKDLNLNDFFFKYGIRVNPDLVKDLYSAPITVAIGEGSQSQFQPVQWQYSPLSKSMGSHPITKNLELVKFDFASSIDTLKNDTQKTILLQSSERSKLEGPLTTISLNSVTSQPNPEEYNQGSQNLAVMLQGTFKSCYSQRILPFKLDGYKDVSTGNPKMLVISDGDLIKNEVSRSGPLELGFDRFTGRRFGNKEFLLNAVNFMLDDNGLIDLRSRDIAIAILDAELIEDQKTKWQFINILLPLILLLGFGLIFNYLRKRKYAAIS
ncbi:gliding motility-associated ABC transporter substrate-binding protein GldG [Winogradskyella aurantiaca]|uniref:gliding motility-associated ABC transporter substrate-binding protein GldG n=1 Tax=Winogradskyella aurantiaca TaxID=2219558 RepID=UPI000E1C80B9|nr:gliding motility-associated ABC transporter substrate-binding protein GldG [Winogradskyella aurantiaca]